MTESERQAVVELCLFDRLLCADDVVDRRTILASYPDWVETLNDKIEFWQMAVRNCKRGYREEFKRYLAHYKAIKAERKGVAA